ncbi:hypothetical protein GGH94_003487 [Coemansia aciculifera]|uniref:Uncharacterized protein n=1 Tax=Coemansia aciculifera TaxID=417176 RepID=A0A9W8IR24_9FUNG|nr:hypothetical protein GGH94_003487 [Coemansia aciculifera]KAJ2873262.1 hypothetical protein GGH93_003368 [Coemansia aciculifera]
MEYSNVPQEIQFQLRDDAQGLTHSATSVSYVFADDPLPLGSDDGQISVVVDMSADGASPMGVRSLSTSFMAAGYEWSLPADSSESSAKLTVHGIALERVALLSQALDVDDSDK